MRYKGKTFKLNEKIFEKLKKIKKRIGKTWNMVFVELIEIYDRNFRNPKK